MKNLIISLLTFASVSALTDSYKCEIAISKDGVSVGTMKIEQDATGTTLSDRLYSLPVSKKKNIFGKSRNVVEIILNGAIMAARDPSEGALKGEFFVATTTETRTSIHTNYEPIAKIDVSGDSKIDVAGAGSTATGSCSSTK